MTSDDQLRIFDTPHPQVTGMQREDLTMLDLEGCNVFTVTMRLHEHEKPSGIRFEQWPQSIRARMEVEIAAWIKAHPNTLLRAMTQGIHEGCCTVALHWSMKP